VPLGVVCVGAYCALWWPCGDLGWSVLGLIVPCGDFVVTWGGLCYGLLCPVMTLWSPGVVCVGAYLPCGDLVVTWGGLCWGLLCPVG